MSLSAHENISGFIEDALNGISDSPVINADLEALCDDSEPFPSQGDCPW